ncbi:hypothetical protein EVAR_25988_1 [Eumeta japonica]|uniref:Uncharacterized protein n=1 Tax=Eumeta variegata TaxID=151549 RepID=A0A4C1V2V8_EUMVA|nr:hypothetical protein EVAR_25988_1 [Eumeta japonica]
MMLSSAVAPSIELNATSKSPDAVTDTEEDVLYQKDVSFSAELEIAEPSTRLSKNAKDNPYAESRQQKNMGYISKYKNNNYTQSGERFKEIDGLKSLMSEGVSENDIDMISDDKRDDEYGAGARDELEVTTQGPSLEQKVPGATVAPPWTAAVAECDCTRCQDNATPKCRNVKPLMPIHKDPIAPTLARRVYKSLAGKLSGGSIRPSAYGQRWTSVENNLHAFTTLRTLACPEDWR